MKIISSYEYQLPDFLLPALFNADLSGLEDEDVKIFNKAEKEFQELVKINKGSNYTIDIHNNEDGSEQEPYFAHDPDFCPLACNVIDCSIHIFE